MTPNAPSSGTEEQAGQSNILSDSARGTPEEREQLRVAAEHLRSAETELARAGAILGHTDRKPWWYEANSLYHSSHKLAEILKREN